jgi:uncharacterized protein YjbI with pentapeptide repeats
LLEVVFDDADLENAKLAITQVIDCSLQRARLLNSHWELSAIDRSRFDDSRCSGMTWLRCEAKGVVFRTSDLTSVTFRESKIRASDFARANFETATFIDVDFLRTTFAFANLKSLATTRLQLIACDLRDAETHGSVLPRNLLALFSALKNKD